MIWIWFGLDGTGISMSPDFHWLLGPTLMVMFAFLGNTLFLTILVSMLSNTFSVIVSNAVQEIQYRRAVLTFEGVKSDAIFAYMPPFNILALILLLPLKLLVSERMFHKINVAVVRTLNLPTLLIIAYYERQTLWVSDKHHSAPKRIDWKNAEGPRVVSIGWWARTMTFWDFSRFSAHGDIQAVFDIEPPQDLLDRINEEDDVEEGGRGGRIGKSLIVDFKDSFVTENGSRRNSSATDGARRASLDPKVNKKRRRELKRVDSLRKEFVDSSEDAENESDYPAGYRKLRRGERMDSIIDYSDTGNVQMQEANSRLHRLEESIARLETMLAQVLESNASENDEGQLELEREVETGTLK